MKGLRIVILVAAALALAACGTTGPHTVANDSGQPPATTTLPPGSTTTLPSIVVPDAVLVPNLTGLTLAEAEALLGEVGLGVTALPAYIGEAIVVAQEPAPGADADEGTVVTVDVQAIRSCNPPDPIAPGPGQAIITVLFECAGDAIAPAPGVGVARIVPEPEQPVDRIEWTLRSVLAGPTPDEKVVGIDSAFDETTAEALNGVTLTDGRLVVDFNDAIIVNNMNTSTGMVFFNAELRRNVFLHPEVDSVEFRFNGDCAAWSALFESDGCWVISRADWDEDVAAWDQARNE